MFTRLATATLFVLLAGCAAKPQNPLQLEKTALAPSGRVGVAMSKLPELTTNLPGAGCLLCIAVASGANRELTEHAKTLSVEDLAQLKDQVAEALRARGADAIVIAEPIDVSSLPSRDAQPNFSAIDHSTLEKKYGVQKLVVINVVNLGFERTYSAYFPTSDPKAVFRATAYLVNTKTNAYDWYLPVNVLKSAGKWDEPPKFPGLTNAYFQALEAGKDAVINGIKE